MWNHPNLIQNYLVMQKDLEAALKGNFAFSGTFATSCNLADAPNPGLTIRGLGLVGLPLSERDAHSIIEQATQAPFGRGTETVIDTEVRDTYEINPARVQFTNPAWDGFVAKALAKHVWPALGIQTAVVPPRHELYKLLLYRPGSHFLPHQE